MRFIPIVSLSIHHRATEDIKFNGFDIDKDTLIITNLYCAMQCEKIWGDPQNFRPERFISKDGTFVRHEALIPFGAGNKLL